MSRGRCYITEVPWGGSLNTVVTAVSLLFLTANHVADILAHWRKLNTQLSGIFSLRFAVLIAYCPSSWINERFRVLQLESWTWKDFLGKIVSWSESRVRTFGTITPFSKIMCVVVTEWAVRHSVIKAILAGFPSSRSGRPGRPPDLGHPKTGTTSSFLAHLQARSIRHSTHDRQPWPAVGGSHVQADGSPGPLVTLQRWGPPANESASIARFTTRLPCPATCLSEAVMPFSNHNANVCAYWGTRPGAGTRCSLSANQRSPALVLR